MLSRRTVQLLGLEATLIRPQVTTDLFGTISYLYSKVTVQLEPIPVENTLSSQKTNSNKTLNSNEEVIQQNGQQLQENSSSPLLVNFYVQPIHEVGRLFRSQQSFVVNTIREEHPEVILSDPVLEDNCEVDALIGQDLLSGAVMLLPDSDQREKRCSIRLKTLPNVTLLATRFGWTVQGSMSEPLVIGNFNKVRLDH